MREIHRLPPPIQQPVPFPLRFRDGMHAVVIIDPSPHFRILKHGKDYNRLFGLPTVAEVSRNIHIY